MPHYVPQQAATFVCVAFGAGQALGSEFINTFWLKPVACCIYADKGIDIKPNSQVVDNKIKKRC